MSTPFGEHNIFNFFPLISIIFKRENEFEQKNCVGDEYNLTDKIKMERKKLVGFYFIRGEGQSNLDIFQLLVNALRQIGKQILFYFFHFNTIWERKEKLIGFSFIPNSYALLYQKKKSSFLVL